jgi:hypothetical protein
VKVDIQEQKGIPAEEQVLIWHTKELDDSFSLAAYGLYGGEHCYTFHLVFRSPSVVAEPPLSIDTVRLWIPSSLEQEIKYRENERRIGGSPTRRSTQRPVVLPVTVPDIVAF